MEAGPARHHRLELPRYRPHAENPEATKPDSLCPTDPRSIELLDELYAELLPHKVGVTVLCPLFFRTNLLDTMRTQKPDYVIVALEGGRTFRHEAYSDYKATRRAMPESHAGAGADSGVRHEHHTQAIPAIDDRWHRGAADPLCYLDGIFPEAAFRQ
jgi:hypothetical protein